MDCYEKRKLNYKILIFDKTYKVQCSIKQAADVD